MDLLWTLGGVSILVLGNSASTIASPPRSVVGLSSASSALVLTIALIRAGRTATAVATDHLDTHSPMETDHSFPFLGHDFRYELRIASTARTKHTKIGHRSIRNSAIGRQRLFVTSHPDRLLTNGDVTELERRSYRRNTGRFAVSEGKGPALPAHTDQPIRPYRPRETHSPRRVYRTSCFTGSIWAAQQAITR
jgi:hypothetical protein